MKKERLISIKNPCLIRFRNNLRRILVNAFLDEISAVTTLKNSAINSFGALDNIEPLRCFHFFKDERIKMRRILRSSICVCGSCMDMEKDHIYYPKDSRWYCVDYFKSIK